MYRPLLTMLMLCTTAHVYTSSRL